MKQSSLKVSVLLQGFLRTDLHRTIKNRFGLGVKGLRKLVYSMMIFVTLMAQS